MRKFFWQVFYLFGIQIQGVHAVVCPEKKKEEKESRNYDCPIRLMRGQGYLQKLSDLK